MASANGIVLRPCPMVDPLGTSGLGTRSINASNVKVGFVMRIETSDSFTHSYLRYGTISAVPPELKVSLQGVNASGFPDGTVKGGGSPASRTWTPGGSDDNTGVWHPLDNSWAGTPGDLVSVVVEYSSGTVGASNLVAFARSVATSFHNQGDNSFPYYVEDTGAGWAKGGTVPPLCFGLRTASNRYGLPLLSVASQSNVTTAGHRFCLKYNMPSSGAIATYTVPKFSCVVTWPSSGSDITFGVWNAAGTALQSFTPDRDTNSGNGTSLYNAFFASPATLSAGTDYYFGVQANGVATGFPYQVVSEADDRLAFELGTAACGATWNGSAWTDQSTWLPAIELHLGEITVASSGGIKSHPGMNGGFNG